MAPPTVPLKELSAAVQSAIQQVLAQHGALGIDHLWVGFVAPDKIATIDNAKLVATQLGHGAGGIAVQPSIAQLSAGVGGEKGVIPKPGHIIGLVYQSK